MERTMKISKRLVRYYSKGVTKKKDEIVIPKGKYLTEPWNERKGIFKSSFRFFEPKTQLHGADFIRLMQTPVDLRLKSIAKWYLWKSEEEEMATQSYNEERHAIVGADLSAAHFVVHRGGAVRFHNESEWVRRDKDGKYILPSQYIPGLYLEAIDCNGMNLRTTGLVNLLDLSKLRWLSFENNPLVDDWMLDSVSGSYGNTLEYLNLTNCRKITYRGLTCFYRFYKLQTLNLSGLSESPEFKLACLMLEDLFPRLQVIGVKHNIDSLADSKSKEIASGSSTETDN